MCAHRHLPFSLLDTVDLGDHPFKPPATTAQSFPTHIAPLVTDVTEAVGLEVRSISSVYAVVPDANLVLIGVMLFGQFKIC